MKNIDRVIRDMENPRSLKMNNDIKRSFEIGLGLSWNNVQTLKI